MNENLEFHKIQLEYYNTYLKIQKKSIRWNIVYAGLCLLNFFVYIPIKFTNNWLFYFYILVSISWSVIIFITIKSIKTKKLQVKINEKLYEEELKIVDYKQYIKNQRLEKLKKLKTSKLFH